jgi:polyphosphate kinase
MHTEAPSSGQVRLPEEFVNRELSWLGFAHRVLSLAESPDLQLLERVKFAGIMGMLHDEFFMKRMSGLKRQIKRGSKKLSLDGLEPHQEFRACREELLRQTEAIARLVDQDLRPALGGAGMPILGREALSDEQRAHARRYFRDSVQPILTPLAVDGEHPFPFISNLGLNLAVLVPGEAGGRPRFVRVKVPNNRPRWVRLPGGAFAPLEHVIADNLDLVFPSDDGFSTYLFRVTRASAGESERDPAVDEEDDLREPQPKQAFSTVLHDPAVDEEDDLREPGRIVKQVSDELKARRFAGVVRLEVDPAMPPWLVEWLAKQLDVGEDDMYTCPSLPGFADLMRLDVPDRPELRYPRLDPATHPRLQKLEPRAPQAIFEEIARGDVLVHHPYDSFDTSVLRFLESAAGDPAVLAIKLTIYRTSADSPIVKALAEAARRGKQVAVLVEITARFDEAPNIAWGQYLEREGVHVAYGVEQLKTHVKLTLVVREEGDRLRRYVHVGTGNYHTGTARIYEDFGLLTCDPEIGEDAARVFNDLTSGMPAAADYRKIIVAPTYMRNRFVELVAREEEHARAGRPSGVYAKMNQLQDKAIIRALYRASQAGVPVTLNVRGLCCLKPGVPGLSENVRLYSVVGRFLEHSRLYRFANGGRPEFFIGSADWMKRNLDNRVETIVPVEDEHVRDQLEAIIQVYESDNASAWDCGADGSYVRRTPAAGEPRRAAQELFIEMARGGRGKKAALLRAPASERHPGASGPRC